MTAAYTNDPISQEQNVEKKTSTIVSKILYNKKEQAMLEESTEFATTGIMKLATGGEEQEEILVNKEKLTLCISVNTSELLEQKVKNIVEYKNNEDSEFLEKNENTSVIIEDIQNATINMGEIKNEVIKDCDLSVPKSSSNLIVSMKVDAFLTECDFQDIISETRETDIFPQDNFKLQELQDSIESITMEISDFSNDFGNCNESLENTILQKNNEEIYDPESELNFHEAVRAGDAKCVAALLASNLIQNLDEPDWNVSGDPPLLVAATNHCLPILR